MWYFLFALFRFLADLINVRFLIFLGVYQILGNLSLGLQEAEKLSESGGKNHEIISRGTDFRAQTKKRYFISIQILKFSSIFNLILQVTLTQTQRISVDSVAPIHSISRPTPITKKNSLFTDERSCKVKSLVDSIPNRFLKFLLRCRKEQLHTRLNVFRRFWICHKASQCAKVGHIQDLFLAPIQFSLFAFIKAWLMLIQNNSNCWIETTQIEIEESLQYKFYNSSGDLSIRSF